MSRELRVPVPWGHLAAKVWGPDNGAPVLALHGRMDNAGSFDTLAPLLAAPLHLRLVCLDFCDHGLSSHTPPGIVTGILHLVYQVKLVLDSLKLDKVSIIGHSMGFLIAAKFTSIFPERVERLVGLDMVFPSTPGKDIPAGMKTSLIAFEEKMRKKHKPMTYHDARNKTIKQYNNSIDENEADVLLVRGLKKIDGVEDQYEFSWAQRTASGKYVTFFETEDQINGMLQNIRCPVLLFKPTGGIISRALSKEKQDQIFSLFRQSSIDFRLVEIEGGHHVHMGHPERVAPHIITFFNSLKSAL